MGQVQLVWGKGVKMCLNLDTGAAFINGKKSACVNIRQHTSTYVNIRQYTTTSVSRRQQKGTYSTPSRLSWMESKARMLTYVDVFWCNLTYVDVCIGKQVAEVTELSNTVTLCPCTDKIKNLHMLYSLSFCRKWRVIVCHDSRPR